VPHAKPEYRERKVKFCFCLCIATSDGWSLVRLFKKIERKELERSGEMRRDEESGEER
jgi:hypothetical protein